MYKLKVAILAIIILSFAACISAQNKTENKKADDKITACEPTDLKTADEIKLIGENSNVNIEKPFIFAARSAETYKLLQEKIKDLPPADEIDFTKQAVIAAFGGEQTSGGYSVSIGQADEKFNVKLNKPASGAITTDLLTYPFQIAVISIEQEESLMIETSDNWKNSSENYKVSSGKFVYSGGFAGRQRSIKPGGTISVWRFEDLVTLFFNVTGTENKKLYTIATGKLTNDEAHFARFEAGEFYESPHPPMIADIVFKNGKVLISLESGKREHTVNDGFSGNGNFEAVKIN